MTQTHHLLTDDDGSPVAFIDMDAITDAETELAFRMAAHCGDPVALDTITHDVMTKVGTGTFGYVAACALRLLAEQILEPALTAGEAAGVHLRPGLLALSEGRDPAVIVGSF